MAFIEPMHRNKPNITYLLKSHKSEKKLFCFCDKIQWHRKYFSHLYIWHSFCIDGEWSYGASYTDIFRGWGASDISMCECHTLNDLVLSSVGKYMC